VLSARQYTVVLRVGPSRPTRMDPTVAELQAAGLITIGFDAEGNETWS
jgi:hypothetical protein